MQIGEVADQVGIATSAIRFYEDKGLIPEPQRTGAGYRDYDSAVVQRLEFIRAGQALGLTLRQLQQVLRIRDVGDSPCQHVRELLDARIEDIDRRIRELRSLRRDLTSLRAHASELNAADCPPESVCRIITVTT